MIVNPPRTTLERNIASWINHDSVLVERPRQEQRQTNQQITNTFAVNLFHPPAAVLFCRSFFILVVSIMPVSVSSFWRSGR